MNPPRKQSLPPQRQRLVELFQQLNFGRVERLRIQSGQPCFDPQPNIIQEVKFGGDNAPRQEADLSNFNLKRQIQELFRYFDRLGNGVIDLIEIRHGLPWHMEVKRTTR
jgi:hypothetical protein